MLVNYVHHCAQVKKVLLYFARESGEGENFVTLGRRLTCAHEAILSFELLVILNELHFPQSLFQSFQDLLTESNSLTIDLLFQFLPIIFRENKQYPFQIITFEMRQAFFILRCDQTDNIQFIVFDISPDAFPDRAFLEFFF